MIVNDTIMWSHDGELLFLDKRLDITYSNGVLGIMGVYTHVAPEALRDTIIRRVLSIKPTWEVHKNPDGTFAGYMLHRWYPGNARMNKHMTGSYKTRTEAHRAMHHYSMKLWRKMGYIIGYHIESPKMRGMQ